MLSQLHVSALSPSAAGGFRYGRRQELNEL